MILPVLVFAQSDKEIEQAKSWLGQWKRNYASPTYGMTFFHGNLEVNGYLPNKISDNSKNLFLKIQNYLRIAV